MAGPQRIGGVAHEGQNALSSQLRKPLQVDGISVDRGEVDLKIARVHDDTRRGIDRQGSSVHDTVVGLDEFDPESPQGHYVSERHYMALGDAEQVVFAELVFDNAHCQPCAVDGNIDFFHYIGERADVILMSVRDHKALHLVKIFLQICHVRDHQIDSEHIVLRKSQTAVHDYDTVLIFKSSDVHSNLLKSAEGNNLHRGRFFPDLFFCSLQYYSSSGLLIPGQFFPEYTSGLLCLRLFLFKSAVFSGNSTCISARGRSPASGPSDFQFFLSRFFYGRTSFPALLIRAAPEVFIFEVFIFDFLLFDFLLFQFLLQVFFLKSLTF